MTAKQGWTETMKFLIILIVLGTGAYLVHNHREAQNPATIESPVYAELRMDARIQGREFNLVLFGEMASQEDCQQRADRTWNKLIDGCKDCTMSLTSCSAQLEPRYRRLFDNARIHSTYLSFTRGSRFERNGRMVVYGLTADEGDAVCESIMADFQTRYEGKVSCIHGRRD
jgi:hypothetical protein